jgi:hypothetical protein
VFYVISFSEMKVLDLFSGLKGWSAAFTERGHEVLTIDIEAKFKPDLVADVLTLDAAQLGKFDLILASPPCECFSVASIGKYWTKATWDTTYAIPKDPRAEHALLVLNSTLDLIEALNPRWFIIENPRGMMRTLQAMEPFARRTVTYCQYGEQRMKPTDLWGGFPSALQLKPPCKNGDSCHISAPRGSTTGTQGMGNAAIKAKIPYALSLAVCLAAEASC